jgi:hypothetical protein
LSVSASRFFNGTSPMAVPASRLGRNLSISGAQYTTSSEISNRNDSSNRWMFQSPADWTRIPRLKRFLTGFPS